MAFTYRIFRRPWRVRRPLFWIMAPELAGVIAVLVLFGVQQPDAFRSLFWDIGYQYRLNSNPKMILYAYANHRPLPDTPFVWSQTLTNFNVAISVVSLFVLLGKMIMTIMKVFYPILGVVVGITMTALYAVSAYGQAGPDYADPRYPSPVPWYIRYGCHLATPFNAEKSCYMAKGTFAATIFLLALYAFQLGLALWAMWPNPMLDLMDDSDDEENISDKKSGKALEMQPSGAAGPSSSGGVLQDMPFTPRTQAFYTLERKLPLRAN